MLDYGIIIIPCLLPKEKLSIGSKFSNHKINLKFDVGVPNSSDSSISFLFCIFFINFFPILH